MGRWLLGAAVCCPTWALRRARPGLDPAAGCGRSRGFLPGSAENPRLDRAGSGLRGSGGD
eukprot:11176864-Lingulodinium_polyedra.AAC.1